MAAAEGYPPKNWAMKEAAAKKTATAERVIIPVIGSRGPWWLSSCPRVRPKRSIDHSLPADDFVALCSKMLIQLDSGKHLRFTAGKT
jgi:hypothetical protein